MTDHDSARALAVRNMRRQNMPTGQRERLVNRGQAAASRQAAESDEREQLELRRRMLELLALGG